MFPSAYIATNAEFIAAKSRFDVTLTEDLLMKISTQLDTDLMWISYHTIVDAFAYFHWRAGVLLRALVCGHTEQAIWERIEGQPEAWEQATFFEPESLELLLDDEDETEEEKQQLREFWQKGELVVGRMEPYASVQDVAFAIATYYRFPGWDK
jgi:hypothetical protein